MLLEYTMVIVYYSVLLPYFVYYIILTPRETVRKMSVDRNLQSGLVLWPPEARSSAISAFANAVYRPWQQNSIPQLAHDTVRAWRRELAQATTQAWLCQARASSKPAFMRNSGWGDNS